jgi:ubiquinone/menaquinone biosynthesis C-methylase UbiE
MKKMLSSIIKKTFLRKKFLSLGIFLNNFSYKIIKEFLTPPGEEHPKHRIINYEKFFLENVSCADKVLEVGCFKGNLSYALSCKAKMVVGIELDKEKFMRAKKKYQSNNLTFILGDVTEYEFKKKFDIVVLSNVLEHIDKRTEFLLKMSRISNKILLRVPLVTRDWLSFYKMEQGFEYRLDKSHYIEYTENGIEEELEKGGWERCFSEVRFGEYFGLFTKKSSKKKK